MNMITPLPSPIAPTTARFIRLGPGGAWASLCLTRSEIRFGGPDEPHAQCLAGDWEGARRALTDAGKRPSEVSQALRELRDFYTLAPETLWITFVEGRLRWGFADAEVSAVGDGPGMVRRRLRGGWHGTNLAGASLRMSGLSSRLTQVNAYQRTICDVRERDYLVRKINGLVEPTVERARAALDAVIVAAEELIARLHWADFEVLADLILMRSGWQRVSDLGKTQADVDLIIAQPATGERAFVQVKSRANAAVLANSVQAYRAAGGFQRMFFVCHSPEGRLEGDAADVAVWSGEGLARRAVDAGLLGWLIERTG